MLDFEYDAELEREVLTEEAHAQGLEQGLEQGHTQGIEQVALHMLIDKQDPAYIMRITGVTAERLGVLQQEILDSST